MENNRYIDILLKQPNKRPRRITIENSISNMEKLVEGDIEVIEHKDVFLILNSSGKYLGLEPNFEYENDLICGSFLIVGDDEINGDFNSLTTKQFRKYRKEFSLENSIKSPKEIVKKKREPRIIVRDFEYETEVEEME